MSGHLSRTWETPGTKRAARPGVKTIRFSAEDIGRIERIMGLIASMGVETDFSKTARYLILVGALALESGDVTIEVETENVKRLKIPEDKQEG